MRPEGFRVTMARVCSICTHDQRSEIDTALLAGEPLRDIAGQFRLSRSALHRHKTDHLAEQMAEVAERNAEADVRTAIDVVSQLKTVNAEAHAVLKAAKAAKDGGLTLQAIDRITKQIELQARLIDLLKDGTTINVVVTPQWVELRSTLLSALQDHPDARLSVAAALQGIEGGADHARIA